MSKFAYARSSERCVVKDKNSPPDVEGIDFTDAEDAFVLQRGRGICKGLASVWVIAFLNGVAEASDCSRFSGWFDIARLHGTEIKNAKNHIDRHVAQIDAANVATNVTVRTRVDAVTVSETQFPTGAPWATYCSIWHHDIAFGAGSGKDGPYFIMDPNDGLAVYNKKSDFVADLEGYVELRRARKNKAPSDTLGLYYCQSRI